MLDKTIEVTLGDRSYPIYVGSGMTSSFAPTCRRHGIPKKIAIVADRNVARYYLKPLENHLGHFDFEVCSIVIPPGERQKSLSRANAIFTTLLENGFGRKSAVIALGGGVVGDLAGFVAATYLRGIPFVQVPTTLLSQSDSSIGGKVAVNHPLGKNMIGAFYQPAFVWADVDVLTTLPEREVVCGLGEIVKYGVIRDESLFRYLESSVEQVLSLDRETILHVQSVCAGIKAKVTSEDERELGVRVILNFGHTIGHALEAAGEFRILKHGEAVLLGMKAETFIAREMGLIPSATHDRIVGLIERIPLKVSLRTIRRSDVVKAMGHDKKSVGRKKRFVLPTKVGEVKVVEDVDSGLIESSLSGLYVRRPGG